MYLSPVKPQMMTTAAASVARASGNCTGNCRRQDADRAASWSAASKCHFRRGLAFQVLGRSRPRLGQTSAHAKPGRPGTGPRCAASVGFAVSGSAKNAIASAAMSPRPTQEHGSATICLSVSFRPNPVSLSACSLLLTLIPQRTPTRTDRKTSPEFLRISGVDFENILFTDLPAQRLVVPKCQM